MTPPFSPNLKLVPERFRDTDAERGTIDVPARHEAPGKHAITLSFVRLPHRGDGPGTPLVFLSGGPGLSGIRSASGRLFPLFDSLRDHGDVILLDQRACVVAGMVPKADDAPPGSRTREEWLEIIARTVSRDIAALANLGIPVAAMDSNQSADDVALIARTLYGSNVRIALLGWSYGSHLAMAIMKRHEAMLSRVVLAAPEGPDHTLKRPLRVQEHLERLGQRARKDVIGMLSRALDRSENRFELQWIISELAADTRALRKLPMWLERMEGGDFQVIRDEPLLRGAWDALHDELPHSAVRYAFDCASGAMASRHALIQREACETLLGNTIDFPLPEICEALGCPDLGDEFRAAPKSNVPVMFITGTLDCRTPPQNVEDLSPGLPDHRHLIVRDAGHGDLLLPSGVHAAIHRFIGGGEPGQLEVAVDTPFAFE
ncbi:MAG TPA: alpha/beta hydrolase [Candidatus Krumholzibacteria bacterium]